MIPKSKILTTSSSPSGMRTGYRPEDGVRMNSSQIKTIQAATKIGYNVTEPNQTQTVTVNIGKDIQEVESIHKTHSEIAEETISVAEKSDST